MKKLIELYKDNLREGLNKYTRKAYLMLPELDKPRILDIGCGSGVPTMELARFLKPNGFLVVHDEITNTKKKLKYIPNCGYKLLGYFLISEDIWWAEYCSPLEKRIDDVRKKYINESRALLELDNEQQEIDMFKKNPKSNRSIFYIMQKK